MLGLASTKQPIITWWWLKFTCSWLKSLNWRALESRRKRSILRYPRSGKYMRIRQSLPECRTGRVGNAGDYETVEIILSGRCVSQKGTLAYHLERYVLDCPASQQHRNKVVVQAELIRSTIA